MSVLAILERLSATSIGALLFPENIRLTWPSLRSKCEAIFFCVIFSMKPYCLKSNCMSTTKLPIMQVFLFLFLKWGLYYEDYGTRSII